MYLLLQVMQTPLLLIIIIIIIILSYCFCLYFSPSSLSARRIKNLSVTDRKCEGEGKSGDGMYIAGTTPEKNEEKGESRRLKITVHHHASKTTPKIANEKPPRDSEWAAEMNREHRGYHKSSAEMTLHGTHAPWPPRGATVQAEAWSWILSRKCKMLYQVLYENSKLCSFWMAPSFTLHNRFLLSLKLSPCPFWFKA